MSDAIHVAAPPAPATLGAGVAAPQPPPGGSLVADRLMNMADHCLQNHLLRQAAEMYFAVLDRRGAGVPETEHARRRLLEIAEYYEGTGNPHQARGIYEQLL